MKGGDIGHKNDSRHEGGGTRYGIGRPCSVKQRGGHLLFARRSLIALVGLMTMRSLFRNRWLSRPQRQSDLFDVFHPRTMSALTGLNGRTLCDWSAADVADVETAPRFILGLLRSSSNLRERFPRALSEEQYYDWLVAGGAKEHGVSAGDIGNVEAAFAAQPGEQIRQYLPARSGTPVTLPIRPPAGGTKEIRELASRQRSDAPFVFRRGDSLVPA